MKNMLIVLTMAVFLGACAQMQTGLTAFRGGIDAVQGGQYKAASLVEDVRCKRRMSLVLKMADERGDEWFNAYVASCPNIQAIIKRVAGAAALSQGFILVPRNNVPVLILE